MDLQLSNGVLVGEQAELASLMNAVIAIHPLRHAHPDWTYTCIEHLVLHRGTWYTPAPLPVGRERGDERHCFANATRHSRAHELIYVEGYALGPHGLVFEHAWCAHPDGTVEDPTWPDGAGLAYLGIPFTAGYIVRFERLRGVTTRLLFDPHLDDWQLLRTGMPTPSDDAPVPDDDHARFTTGHHRV
ncbi:hypothetical protein [Umezawaea sp. Da 62-37]|uniref:hypothetical protein n=1 Tax=Umezawaea sp. Da 62-37 TaxID=3075927 RepID=UPI0028F729DE|nr:hypothetical protein [Umezawaea sp. Da 62-37]WNV84729.1 hypothetical protein RM788_42295 [Umezawaea sp. Da 62-37]